jgi:dTDP-4-dehydrorhamnose 3,5-epimerase
MTKDNFEVIETKFSGVWLRGNTVYSDERGSTSEILNVSSLTFESGKFDVSQILESRSHKSVIRGIHYSDVSNPQIKVVKCITGHIRDCVIDLRAGSATFGQFDVFELSSKANQTLIISPGFGHAYEVITETATVLYAMQTNFAFHLEYSIDPLDPDLALPWESSKPILSEKDSSAKSFAVAAREILGSTRL